MAAQFGATLALHAVEAGICRLLPASGGLLAAGASVLGMYVAGLILFVVYALFSQHVLGIDINRLGAVSSILGLLLVIAPAGWTWWFYGMGLAWAVKNLGLCGK